MTAEASAIKAAVECQPSVPTAGGSDAEPLYLSAGAIAETLQNTAPIRSAAPPSALLQPPPATVGKRAEIQPQRFEPSDLISPSFRTKSLCNPRHMQQDRGI